MSFCFKFIRGYYRTPIIIIFSSIIIIIKLQKKSIIEALVPTTNLPPPFGLTLATALIVVELDAIAAVLKLTVPTLVVLTALIPVVALDIDTLEAIPLAVKMPPPPPDVIVAEVIDNDETAELPTVAARTNTKSFNTTALSAITGVPIACRFLFLYDAAITITVSAGLPQADDADVGACVVVWVFKFERAVG